MNTQLSRWDARMHETRQASEGCEARRMHKAAQDPHATAAVLADIWQKAGRQEWIMTTAGTWLNDEVILTLEAVASHPNTPPEILYALSAVCARAFCANPIASFVLLETPDFASHLSHELSEGILRNENAPPVLVSSIMNHAKYRGDEVKAWEAQQHITLAGEITTEAAWRREVTTFWQNFGSWLARQPEENAPSLHWYCDLVELGLSPSWMKNDLPPEILEPTIKITQKTAASRAVAPELRKMQKRIATEREAMVQRWLAWQVVPDSAEEREIWAKIAPYFKTKPNMAAYLRKTATPDNLIKLIRREDWGGDLLRQMIVVHPAANSDVFRALIKGDSSERVRALLAACPQIPVDILSKLVTDEDALVRRLARRNPRAEPEMQNDSRRAVCDLMMECTTTHSSFSFIEFIGGMNGVVNTETFYGRAEYGDMASRLTCALTLPTDLTPIYGDVAKRTSVDLLEHLARDGNRLVRWAAQKRLDDPGFIFAWQETD